MEIIHGNENDFNSLIQDDLVLVDFYADWCGPCKMLAPILEEVASDRDSVKIVKINVDENENLAREFSIMSIPTLMLFKNGNQISRKVGFMQKEALDDWLNDNR